MFNRVWHLIRHVTNPVMQIEPFVLFDMERWAMKWKISPEMRRRGHVPSALAAVIIKMRTSTTLVCHVEPGHIKLALCFSPHRHQKSSLSLRKCFNSRCKQGQDNGPLGACSLKSHQPVTSDVNNSNVLSFPLHDRRNAPQVKWVLSFRFWEKIFSSL